ncbi:MAG TPA: hypothetical protein VFJ28_06245, partial [Marmoricola sp.]|nr:hypothetical protein [Marmoricola sp.]
DRALADALREDEQFSLRRLRRTSVRGYRRLEPWLLRRPADQDPEITEDGEMPGPVSAIMQKQAQDFRRAVDQIETRLERSAEGERTDQGPRG